MVQEPPAWNWARRRFGDDAQVLRGLIPAAFLAAHDHAMAAHEAGSMDTRDVYGICLHVKQYEELVRAVLTIEGARSAKLGRHPLGILQDTVFYPWRYSVDGRTPIDQARLRRPVSSRRERLFKAHGPEAMQPALDPSLETPLDEELLQAFPALGEGTRLVLVAYASSVDGGILRIYWGEAELAKDGLVVWHYREELALPGDGFGFGFGPGGSFPVRPVGPIPTGGGPRFDEGDMPSIEFPTRPRPVKETSSEVEEHHAKEETDEGP